MDAAHHLRRPGLGGEQRGDERQKRAGPAQFLLGGLAVGARGDVLARRLAFMGLQLLVTIGRKHVAQHLALQGAFAQHHSAHVRLRETQTRAVDELAHVVVGALQGAG